MQQKTLQQIDQELIGLLSERISVLAASGKPVLEEQLANCKPLLTQAGVPEFVWQHIVTSCLAAVNVASLPQQQSQSRRVTVIGGRGMMGCFFTERLQAAGHQLKILECDDWDNAESLLSKADLVLICVPLNLTVSVIQKVAKYLSPDAVLVDIASIKTPIVQAMLKHHAGPVLSLHPMFGPGVKSFLSQKVVICPGRKQGAYQWFLDLIENDGGKLITATPEEHDRIMVTIQAIRHFSTFSLGVFLAAEETDIARSLEFASPVYRLESNLVSRLFAQDGSLYIDIILASEERTQAVSRLAQTYHRLAELVARKDRAALMREFTTARNAFVPQFGRAFAESNYLIDTLSTLLAASKVQNQSLPATSRLT